MKFVTRSLLAFLLLAVAAEGLDWAGGIKAGPLLSFAGTKDDFLVYGPTNFLGVKAGAFYSQRISPRLSLQAEVQFALKGLSYRDFSSDRGGTLHFNYLEFPVLLSTPIAGDASEFFCGPYFAVRLGQALLNAEDNWTLGEKTLKAYDWGVYGGARIWWRDVSFEVHFSHGLISVLPTRLFYGHYNLSLTFQVGYRLFKSSQSN